MPKVVEQRLSGNIVSFNEKSRFAKEGYKEVISVNGSELYEEPWTFEKKFLTRIFFWVSIIVAYIQMFMFQILIRPFIGRNNPMKNDPRLWPAVFLLYSPASAVVYLKRHATTWQAIEYLYTWNEHVKDLKGFDRILSNFLGGVENILATRNRFRLLKTELFQEVDRLIRSGKRDIKITSLAAGSARGPIEVMAYFIRRDPTLLNSINLHLIDFDEESYEFAKKLAAEQFHGLENRLTFLKSKISSEEDKLKELGEYLKSLNPDIVEMVGFTDYMKKEKATKVFSVIYEILNSGGLFITNNVKPNAEQPYLESVVTWKMLNRTEGDMLEIFKDSGFIFTRILNEPTNIQPVYTARKG